MLVHIVVFNAFFCAFGTGYGQVTGIDVGQTKCEPMLNTKDIFVSQLSFDREPQLVSVVFCLEVRREGNFFGSLRAGDLTPSINTYWPHRMVRKNEVCLNPAIQEGLE